MAKVATAKLQQVPPCDRQSLLRGPAVEGDTIKIGLVASLNGDLRPWGIDSERGAKLAVKQINENGGINGKQVQLIVEDSASTPEGGKSAAEKLISNGVVGLVGEVFQRNHSAYRPACV